MIRRRLVPAPVTLASCALLGVVAVLLLPESAWRLPWGDRPEPNEAQLAVTSLGVLILSGVYLRRWAWPSKLGVVLGLLVFAIVSRAVAAVALGRATADYLEHLFTGAGLWLPALIVAASWLAVEAFDRAAHADGQNGSAPDAALRTAFGAGFALVAVDHALWVVFMLGLF